MMATPNDLSSAKDSASIRMADHYRLLAKNYDYFFNKSHDAIFTVLLKYFDVQPDHIVVDIGSGTGYVAERLYERMQLRNPVWCVDPSAEMQEEAKRKKGVFPIQKTADEFYSQLGEDQHFDRALCFFASHHFSDPLKIFRGVEASLSPGGVLLVVQGGGITMSPMFKKAGNLIGDCFCDLKENTSLWLRSTNFHVEVSEENVDYSIKKSQWYDMLRGRYVSYLRKLSDEEIEEGIDELEKGKLKDLTLSDDINISGKLVIFTARKKKKTERGSKLTDQSVAMGWWLS